MTKQEFIDMVVANAKTKKWLNGYFAVDGMPAPVGIKAFGNWVQVAECNGVKTSTGAGIKTRKAFRAAVERCLKELTA